MIVWLRALLLCGTIGCSPPRPELQFASEIEQVGLIGTLYRVEGGLITDWLKERYGIETIVRETPQVKRKRNAQAPDLDPVERKKTAGSAVDRRNDRN